MFVAVDAAARVRSLARVVIFPVQLWIAGFLLLAVPAWAQHSAARQAADKAVSARLWAVQERMEVKRTDYGRGGMSFKVRIFPPETPAFDPAAFPALSPLATTIGVPCQRVQMALKAHGPTGAADLDVPVGLERSVLDDSILIQFRLPQWQSGHEFGHPHLILVCSEIRNELGDVIDWVPVILTLEERKAPERTPSPQERAKTRAVIESLYGPQPPDAAPAGKNAASESAPPPARTSPPR